MIFNGKGNGKFVPQTCGKGAAVINHVVSLSMSKLKGVTWLLMKKILLLELATTEKTTRQKLLSKKYSFEYLPLYEHIIEVYSKKSAEYYFNTDFHFNRKGSNEVFNYIMLNKY